MFVILDKMHQYGWNMGTVSSDEPALFNASQQHLINATPNYRAQSKMIGALCFSLFCFENFFGYAEFWNSYKEITNNATPWCTRYNNNSGTLTIITTSMYITISSSFQDRDHTYSSISQYLIIESLPALTINPLSFFPFTIKNRSRIDSILVNNQKCKDNMFFSLTKT